MGDPGAAGEIFISYAHQDRERARTLVEALRRQGIEVWWDQNIVAGQNWENEIEGALQRSRAVVLVWSQHSVVSEEVKEEANYARSQGKLIPVRLDDAVIPLRYRRIQTLELAQWDGADDHAVFRDLLDGVRGSIGKAAVPGGASKSAWKASLVSWAWLVLPSVAIGGLAVGLMAWRAPTEMEIEVTCRRVRFHSQATNQQQVLLDSARVNSIVLRGFQEVSLPVSAVEAANPAKWDDRANEYAEDAWIKIPRGPGLVFRPAGRLPAQITLEPAAKTAGPLVLERIFTGPAAITLSSPEKGTLNVGLGGQKFSGSVTLPDKTKLIAADCSWEGAALPWKHPSVTLRLSLPGRDALLGYKSGDAEMVLVLGFPSDHKDAIMEPASFEIDRLEFLDDDPAGPLKSSIKADGTIRYLQYPAMQAVAVKAGNFLTLEDLKSFYLGKVAFTEQQENLRISFQGVAGKALRGPRVGAMRDLRLTRFEMLWSNQKLVALFTVLAWVVATSLGLRRYLIGPK